MSDEKVRAEDFRLVPRTGDLYRVCDLLEVSGRVLCEIRDLLEPREESVPTPAASENVSFCSDVRPRYWMVGTLDSGVMGRALPDGESEVMEPTTAVDLLNELSEPAASDAGEGVDPAVLAGTDIGFEVVDGDRGVCLQIENSRAFLGLVEAELLAAALNQFIELRNRVR